MSDTPEIARRMLVGARAKRCELWRPMIGMTVMEACTQRQRTLVSVNRGPYEDSSLKIGDYEFPLFDAPTKGCLLQLVREGWGQPEIYCSPAAGGGWLTWVRETLVIMGHASLGQPIGILGSTEEESMLSALEAAWEDAMKRRKTS